MAKMCEKDSSEVNRPPLLSCIKLNFRTHFSD